MRQRRRFWILGTLGLLILHPLLGGAEARSEATETAAMRLQRGFEALDEGDWDSAAVLFGGLSREHTTEAEIFYYLGVAEASRGDDYAAALAFANAADRYRPQGGLHAGL